MYDLTELLFVNISDNEEKLTNVKRINYKTTYKIFVGNKKEQIKFKTPPLYIPFGIEHYQNKKILNIELPNNNRVHNFMATIQHMDSIFEQLFSSEELQNTLKYKISRNMIDNLKNKQFINSIKSGNKYNPKIRTHVKHQLKIKNANGNILMPHTDLKKTSGICEIILDSIWINDDSYGLVYYVNEIIQQ